MVMEYALISSEGGGRWQDEDVFCQESVESKVHVCRNCQTASRNNVPQIRFV